MNPSDKEFRASGTRPHGLRRLRWSIDAAVVLWLICAWLIPEWAPGVGTDAGVFGDYVSRLRHLAVEKSDLAFVSYVAFMALSSIVGLPPPNVLGLAGAAVFGFWPAFSVAWPSAVVGGVVAAWVVRRFLQPRLRSRWPEATDGVARAAAAGPVGLVLSMRLTPVVPAILANLFIGVTNVRLWTFAWASLIGRAPLTFLYCRAGEAIGSSLSGGVLVDQRAATLLAAAALLPHALAAAKTALVGGRRSAVQG